VGLIAATAAGRDAALRLAQAWPGRARLYPGPVATALPAAFAECDGVVAFLAAGAVIRVLAAHLRGKDTDPGVVCVDEAGRWAVALLGGHGGGANELAGEVAAVLGAQAVVTTATDATGLPGLDDLGWPAEGDLAAVTRVILDGRPVALLTDQPWPIPALPPNVAAPATPDRPTAMIVISDRLGSPGQAHRAVRGVARPVPTVTLRPPSLVIGMGASRGVGEAEAGALVDAALARAGLSPRSVRCLATAEVKADEPGLLALASRRGWPLVTHPAEALTAVAVPNPSEVVRAAVGTPSVAEAAALLGDGTTSAAVLVVTKTASARATVAVARHRPRGRLAVVGLGPGARDLLTPRAAAELRRASVVVGLDQYVDQIRDLLRPGTRVVASGLGAEQERARCAVEQASRGHAVALVGSGDAGVYAMGSPALALCGPDVEVVGVPGVTAAIAAAALLGAPLGHDHALISLSDLHTPWEAIERRLQSVAEGDLVVALYNPRSRARGHQLPRALTILAACRPPDTPVGVVRQASRPGERVLLTTLAGLDPEQVDMLSTVIIGSTRTVVVAGRMVTPREYRWSS
jgi:cobalt-precorrin 5A hydrolase/precorrin-3B C17-methyltransferase